MPHGSGGFVYNMYIVASSNTRWTRLCSILGELGDKVVNGGGLAFDEVPLPSALSTTVHHI